MDEHFAQMLAPTGDGSKKRKRAAEEEEDDEDDHSNGVAFGPAVPGQAGEDEDEEAHIQRLQRVLL